ncbi:hypothetical protein DEO72_LG7g1167 [Vigna unguiculata]|uniref:Uncharacterized protein n=1 Tax=Vigna unguiculata TaxID=3917 RepID=A0A4D6MGK7_VIGUN|nr:hypothetical protein DEO72_LG7g1167 [Vigna unguiculata]
MNQISLTTKLALNEFQASCYSHHRSQSALTYSLAQPLAQVEGPHSGETCSLRRAPLRLGEGSKRRAGAHAGSRLGEAPLAWARCSLAQNVELGDLSHRNPRRAPCLSRLGETDPLGRDLQVSPLVHLKQPCFPSQPNIQSVFTHRIERLNHTSSNQLKHRPKRLETKNSNFPYLEKLSEDLYFVTTSTAAPRMHFRAVVRVEQNQTSGLAKVLTTDHEKVTKRELARTRKSLTWSNGTSWLT